MLVSSDSLYQPLEGENAVRFVNLLPGEASEQLSLELVYASVTAESLQAYNATSYTWGSPDHTKTVLCNGCPFELRENAHNFLHQLRLPYESRLLWMDCICINQDDKNERAEQVKIMHLIYQKAQRVLIWLGPSDELSAIAMDYIRQLEYTHLIQEELAHSFSGGVGKSFHLQKKSLFFDSVEENEQSKRLVQALAALFSRPWFRRVWVQQEAVFGRDPIVICGPDEVSWERLLSAVWFLTPRDSNGWPSWTDVSFFRTVEPTLLAVRTIQGNRRSHFRVVDPEHLRLTMIPDPAVVQTETDFSLQQSFRDGAGSFISHPFTKLAGDCSWCEATDPRDKVYALYNLDRSPFDDLLRRPKIDYTIPWQTVFIRATKWMFETQPVHTLELAGRSRHHGINIPSWVPDFRFELDIAFIPHFSWTAGGTAYRPSIHFLTLSRPKAGPHPIPSYFYENEQAKKKRVPNEALELTAILQDRIVYHDREVFGGLEIENLTRSYRLKDNVDKILEKLSADLTYIQKNLTQYFTGESATEAYAGTIIANTTHQDNLASKEYEVNGFAEWHAWLQNGLPGPDPVYHDAVDNAEVLVKIAFGITAHGLMCLTPAMTTTGDYVAILNGFRFPVALRRVGPQDQQNYELLGPCYIHRMMRGRAWSLIEEFKCKYRPGSEDEIMDEALSSGSNEPSMEGSCDTFPYNARSDYRRVVRVLGKRRIVLV